MSWFRFYTDVLNDPKVQRLPAETFRTWVNLLCLAKEHDGVLPDLPDVAFALRIGEEQAAGFLAELTERGLLDREELNTLIPHNWAGRQYPSDNSTERTRRYRAKIAGDASLNNGGASGTFPERHRERSGNALEQSRTDTEQSRAEHETVYSIPDAPPLLLAAFLAEFNTSATQQEARQIAALTPRPEPGVFAEALARAHANGVKAIIPWVSKRLADATHPNGAGPPLSPQLVTVEEHLAAGPRRRQPITTPEEPAHG